MPEKIHGGEADNLVGTQMLSKGHIKFNLVVFWAQILPGCPLTGVPRALVCPVNAGCRARWAG